MKAGHYSHVRGHFEWELVSKSTLSKVVPDGVWKSDWGMQTAASGCPMYIMWYPQGLTQVNFPLFTNTNHRNPGEAAGVAYQFGSSTYYKPIWGNFHDAKCVVEVRKTLEDLEDLEEEPED